MIKSRRTAVKNFRRFLAIANFERWDLLGTVDNIYLDLQVQQRATIADLVGSEDLANDYVHDNDDFYMARGHLAPNADFVFYSHQVKTLKHYRELEHWKHRYDLKLLTTKAREHGFIFSRMILLLLRFPIFVSEFDFFLFKT